MGRVIKSLPVLSGKTNLLAGRVKIPNVLLWGQPPSYSCHGETDLVSCFSMKGLNILWNSTPLIVFPNALRKAVVSLRIKENTGLEGWLGHEGHSLF